MDRHSGWFDSPLRALMRKDTTEKREDRHDGRWGEKMRRREKRGVGEGIGGHLRKREKPKNGGGGGGTESEGEKSKVVEGIERK